MSEQKKRVGRATATRGIKDLGNGRFLVRARVKDPSTGREVERERRVSANGIREAKLIKIRFEDELANAPTQVARAPERVQRLLGNYARDWLERKCAAKRRDGTSRLDPSTRARYANTIKNLIVPYLGSTDIRSLSRTGRGGLEEWRDVLGAEYAASTVNGALRVLRTMLKDAEPPILVATTVKALEEDDARTTDQEPNLLTGDEIVWFVEAIKKVAPTHHAMVLVMLTTGQRISTVRTKTDRTSAAQAALLGFVGEALKAHRGTLTKVQLASGWAFPSASGRPLARSVLDKPFRNARAEAGITKRLTPHGCRRTASTCLSQNADTRVTMAIVGHRDEKMHRHYSPVRTRSTRQRRRPSACSRGPS